MATNTFSSIFYAAQSTSMQLENELIALEKMGLASLNTITHHHLDLEGGEGNSHPVLTKMSIIGSLIEKLTQQINECRRVARTPLEKNRLTSLDRTRADAATTLQRFRNKLQEKQRQLNVHHSLFADVQSGEDGPLLGSVGNTARYVAKEGDVLRSAMRHVQNSLSSASASWGSLQRQSDVFKQIQEKALGAANSLGMSQNVIGWIERQENINALITYVGMALTIIIIILFYHWWKS